MTPTTRLILFYHTKGTSLRFRRLGLTGEQEKVGKEREGKENKTLGWHFHTSVGGIGVE